MLVLTPYFGIRGLAMALIIAELSMALIGWWLVRQHLIRGAKTMWQCDY